MAVGYIPTLQKKRHYTMSDAERERRRLLPQRFKKGQSGNPAGGVDKGRRIKAVLQVIGDLPGPIDAIQKLQVNYPKQDFSKLTNLQTMLYTAVYFAANGDHVARQFVAEQLEGKIKEMISITDDVTVVDVQDAVTTEPPEGKRIANDRPPVANDGTATLVSE